MPREQGDHSLQDVAARRCWIQENEVRKEENKEADKGKIEREENSDFLKKIGLEASSSCKRRKGVFSYWSEGGYFFTYKIELRLFMVLLDLGCFGRI